MKILVNILIYCIVLWSVIASFSSCGSNAHSEKIIASIDSLNRLSYSLRYKDLCKSSEYAERAYDLSGEKSSGRDVALNNMGFCAFMRMDFEKSISLYKKVIEISDNEIECLIADVGLMKISQRTSSNKDFFDYRNRAARRIKRIKSDKVVFEDSVFVRRFNYALSEYHIVSGIYYYYLQQDKESLYEIDKIEPRSLESDTAQFLYYMYMRGSGGMYSAPTHEKIVLGEFKYLMDCIRLAKEHNYIYFEANALQAMAEILNFSSNRELIFNQKKEWLEMINRNDCPLDSLPLSLAYEALDLFKQYGDWYQISGTYRTIATYYNYIGHPEKALPLLDKALQYVNLHHEKYYACNDTTDRLKTYDMYVPYSRELEWINSEGIKTVPEWIARLREQLSRTYSAMDMKPESDYNRNMYLDILDYTRQDKELESRFAALENVSMLLNMLLLIILLGCFILVIFFVYLNKYWNKRNIHYIDKLKKVLVVCRNMTASVPLDAYDVSGVREIVENVVRNDILIITFSDDLWIELNDSEDETSKPEWAVDGRVPVFDLIAPDKNVSIGRLWLKRSVKLGKDEIYFLKLIIPYMAWTLENGLNFMAMTDEKLRLEKEEYIHRQHIVYNKKQNEIKKACMSIVVGMLPFIDRIINEVEKLKENPKFKDSDIRDEKLDYIDDLLSKVNEYNDILATWIKLKRGEISLNIENFELDELFSVLQKGRRNFEYKHLDFIVEKSNAVVKADKALTMFMINTLVDNARKYTSENGFVKLYASETDKYVEVSVADNGQGLSQSDVDRLLSEKVYDSCSIGMETATDTEALKKQKGNGFGIMNCKGIIEKYKKTSPLFNVCMFGINSQPGKGSRFFFRLPKGGVRRTIICILSVLMINIGSLSANLTTDKANDSLDIEASDYVVTGYDSLLYIANHYANQVYECNVNGNYHGALDLADSVFYYMNKHYLKYSGKKGPLLEIDGFRDIPELTWLSDDFDTDYYIILDVRNEVAVSSLAVKDFSKYYFNNRAYTILYKQISEDKSLQQYCENMQKSSNNKIVAIVFLIVIIIVGIIAFYMIYLRHMLKYRYNMEQVLTINQAVFSSMSSVGRYENKFDICLNMIKIIYKDINELISINNLVIGIYDEDNKSLKYSWYKVLDDEYLIQKLEKSYTLQKVICDDDNMWLVIPLFIDTNSGVRCIGCMGLRYDIPYVREEDILMIELVSEYIAVALYYTIIQTEKRCQDIELARDETSRAEYEENLIHVQNLVLDNCLSTLKHETIYYPGRLKKIIEQIRKKDISNELELKTSEDNYVENQISGMFELVSYYRDIFTLLSSCASRIVDDVTFRRTVIDVSTIAEYAWKYFSKMNRKKHIISEFDIDVKSSSSVIGDETLVYFLLENLIDESMRYLSDGKIKLSMSDDDGFVRFDFIDYRRSFTQKELNLFFYPDNAKIRMSQNGEEMTGTEYLLCKQIIRDHDEYSGRRGCRINATVIDGGKGFSVWFTLPIKR